MSLPRLSDREPRDPVRLTGSITLPDGRPIPVTVVDVSASGWCVECEELLPIAETVRLELAGGVIDVQVRWALPGMAGLKVR